MNHLLHTAVGDDQLTNGLQNYLSANRLSVQCLAVLDNKAALTITEGDKFHIIADADQWQPHPAEAIQNISRDNNNFIIIKAHHPGLSETLKSIKEVQDFMNQHLISK